MCLFMALLYREVASNKPLSKVYMYIVYFHKHSSYIRGVLRHLQALSNAQCVFLYNLFRKLKNLSTKPCHLLLQYRISFPNKESRIIESIIKTEAFSKLITNTQNGLINC